MNLRLQISTASGYSASFQHRGPIIRIGRDHEAELPLQGEAGHAVSGQHARIDLLPTGALLADNGSRNGTLLNNEMIKGTVPLRVGDRIGLGHTGATLTILELDLTPAPVAAPVPRRAPLLSKAAPTQTRLPVPRTALLAAGAVAGILILALGAWLLTRGARKPSPATEEVRANSNPPPGTLRSNPPPAQPTPPNLPTNPEPKPPPPPTEPEANPLAGEVREVGHFVSLPQWGPGVLLQRQGDAYPWLPVRPEGKVSTASTLVSLPGYRSTVALDNGVFLTLWGNLPEFSGFPPVQESVVMLNTPAAGFDLDLSLDRGRIHLINRKPAGPARVQVRFLRQAWTLTLPDAESEACVELWSPPTPAATETARVCLGLFTRSRAQLQTPDKAFELPASSRVTWVNRPGAVPSQETLPELPDWWARMPDRGQPQVQDAMLALLDWSAQLGRSNEIIDTLLTRIRESTDATHRVIGVQFIAALEETPFLVDFLEDRQHAEVRGASRHSLQAWLLHRPRNQDDLVRMLREKRGYSRDKAALVVRLLHAIPEADLARAETYQGLIDLLDHENLVVRDLAFWHLALLVPEGARTIDFNPIHEADKRREAVDKWRKLVPRDHVPRLKGKPGE